MCTICKDAVAEMGVTEADLPNLAFKMYRWYCGVEGCQRYTRVKEFGLPPYFFWPVKQYHNEKKKLWRGGWIEGTAHAFLCGDHWKPVNDGRIIIDYTPKLCLSKFKLIE